MPGASRCKPDASGRRRNRCVAPRPDRAPSPRRSLPCRRSDSSSVTSSSRRPSSSSWVSRRRRRGSTASGRRNHFHPWQDNQGHAGQAWVTLAALGQRTTIPFGTGVTCPTYRYEPAVVAQAFASLGVLYPGRVFLGTGTGEAVNEFPASHEWGRYRERADRLAEATEIIRRLWSGEWVSFQGQYYNVDDAHLYDLPREPIPIYMSGTGPQSAELAGRIADGLVGSAKETTTREIRDAWERGVRAAGKEPRGQEILAELMVVVGGEAEAREAADKWRFQPHAWDRYVEVPDPRTIAEEAQRQIPAEDAMKTYVIGDDPEPHVRRLTELFRAGITQAYVHSGQSDQRRVVEFYGSQVLPALRRELGHSAAA
ncbi:MAG TPA: TIGR03557 family F420-dependent LLM class oxidoreductase [Candidatus Limnocylindrales bacterium]|nr:TIGR03557 family F420-dependent LLM class oxidoreductase [Candidatus Limnocylindrales bacterium]